MARSILGLLGLGATLIFALPAAMLGLDYLIQGRTTAGLALIGAGALMIVVEELVTTPGDVTGIIAKQTVGRVVDVDDDES